MHGKRTRPLVCLVVASLVLLAGAGVARSQSPPYEELTDEEVAFYRDTERLRAAAVAQLVAARDPLVVALMRMVAKRANIWDEPEFPPDEPRPLNERWLRDIRDDTMPAKLGDRFIPEIAPHELADARLTIQAIRYAYDTHQDVFKKYGEANPVTWDKLMKKPAEYRGKVVSLSGTLRRLVAHDPTDELKDALIDKVYEAWVRTTGAEQSTCVLFTILDPALEPYVNKDVRDDVPVTIHGYFIKRRLFENKDDEKKATPLIIARTLTPGAVEEADEFTIPFTVLVGMGGLLFVIVLFMLGVSRWYRRGDRLIMAKVEELRAAQTMRMLEEGLAPQAEAKSALSPERNGATDETVSGDSSKAPP